MAAPSHQTRVAPVGIMLENGHPCRIAFSLDTDVSIWEISISPPSDDGGEVIDTTTQWNAAYRSKAFRTLIDSGDGSVTFGYDPIAKTQLRAMVNREQTFTIRYPDGSQESWFGAIRVIEFDVLEEGTMPMGTMTFTPSNADPVSGDEEGPTLTSVAGT